MVRFVTAGVLQRLRAQERQVGYKLLFVRQVPSSITLRGKSHLLEGVVALRPICAHHWMTAPPNTPPSVSTPLSPLSITLNPFALQSSPIKPALQASTPNFQSVLGAEPLDSVCQPSKHTRLGGEEEDESIQDKRPDTPTVFPVLEREDADMLIDNQSLNLKINAHANMRERLHKAVDTCACLKQKHFIKSAAQMHIIKHSPLLFTPCDGGHFYLFSF